MNRLAKLIILLILYFVAFCQNDSICNEERQEQSRMMFVGARHQKTWIWKGTAFVNILELNNIYCSCTPGWWSPVITRNHLLHLLEGNVHRCWHRRHLLHEEPRVWCCAASFSQPIQNLSSRTSGSLKVLSIVLCTPKTEIKMMSDVKKYKSRNQSMSERDQNNVWNVVD